MVSGFKWKRVWPHESSFRTNREYQYIPCGKPKEENCQKELATPLEKYIENNVMLGGGAKLKKPSSKPEPVSLYPPSVKYNN